MLGSRGEEIGGTIGEGVVGLSNVVGRGEEGADSM